MKVPGTRTDSSICMALSLTDTVRPLGDVEWCRTGKPENKSRIKVWEPELSMLII